MHSMHRSPQVTLSSHEYKVCRHVVRRTHTAYLNLADKVCSMSQELWPGVVHHDIQVHAVV